MTASLTCRTAIIVGISIAGCKAAANEPRPGVMVVREAGHYMITLLNCGDPKWSDPPIVSIDVGKSPPGLKVAAQCRLLASSGAGNSLTQWQYGAQPPGFDLETCAALEHGLTYEIFVFQWPKPALGRFRVENNGEVTMLDGPCRK